MVSPATCGRGFFIPRTCAACHSDRAQRAEESVQTTHSCVCQPPKLVLSNVERIIISSHPPSKARFTQTPRSPPDSHCEERSDVAISLHYSVFRLPSSVFCLLSAAPPPPRPPCPTGLTRPTHPTLFYITLNSAPPTPFSSRRNGSPRLAPPPVAGGHLHPTIHPP